MGSPGRLIGASLGMAVFLKNHAIKLHSIRRGGVPPGAATFIVVGNCGVSAPYIIVLSMHALST